MHIGIDGYEANVTERVGIGQYAFQLLYGLYHLDTKHSYTIFLPTEPLKDMPKETSRWQYRIGTPQSLWTIRQLPKLIKKTSLNLFFTPSHYAPFFTTLPKVISIMDLSYLCYPSLFQKKDLLQLRVMGGYSMHRASHILTISEFTKQQIIKHYHVDPEKITITYPGLSPKLKNQTAKTEEQFARMKKEQGINDDYLLFVGTIQPRKNLSRLVSAFEKLTGQTQLVIIGKKGWLYEPILKKIDASAKTTLIKQLDFVPDELLSHFYENARAFVLPSLYEGFGIPVVEALSHGCPVVISKTSSLPEVAGEAGIYIDPLNISDIAEGLSKALQLRPEERRKLIIAGYKHIKQFSWEHCTKKTIEVFEGMK